MRTRAAKRRSKSQSVLKDGAAKTDGDGEARSSSQVRPLVLRQPNPGSAEEKSPSPTKDRPSPSPVPPPAEKTQTFRRLLGPPGSLVKTSKSQKGDAALKERLSTAEAEAKRLKAELEQMRRDEADILVNLNQKLQDKDSERKVYLELSRSCVQLPTKKATIQEAQDWCQNKASALRSGAYPRLHGRLWHLLKKPGMGADYVAARELMVAKLATSERKAWVGLSRKVAAGRFVYCDPCLPRTPVGEPGADGEEGLSGVTYRGGAGMFTYFNGHAGGNLGLYHTSSTAEEHYFMCEFYEKTEGWKWERVGEDVPIPTGQTNAHSSDGLSVLECAEHCRTRTGPTCEAFAIIDPSGAKQCRTFPSASFGAFQTTKGDIYFPRLN